MDEAKARLVIVTGMSGAGKSTALRCFEDLGYFCLDNIPPRLIEMLLLLSEQAQAGLQGIAIVCDVRSGTMFDDVSEVVEKLSADDRPLDIIYIRADGTVDSIVRGEPFSLAPLRSRGMIRYVLEVNAGMAEKTGIRPGSRIRHPLVTSGN